jgi:hypothetical protein
MRIVRSSAFTFVLFLLLGSAGAAQSPTPTVPGQGVGPCGLQWPAGGVASAELTRLYESGAWADFQAGGLELLRSIKNAPDPGCPAIELDPARDYVLLVWVGTTTLGDTNLFSAIVHQGSSEGYASRLPGLSRTSRARLFQVFVGQQEMDALAAVYFSTREEHPLLKQIPDVAEKILGPMFDLIKANVGAKVAARPEAARAIPPTGWATVSRVDLPFERATVQVAMKAGMPPRADLLKFGSASLATSLTLIEARYSQCAKDLARALDQVVQENSSCVGQSTSCLQQLDSDFIKAYQGAYATCPPSSASDVRTLQLVDSRFRTMLARLAHTLLDGSLEIKNVPLTRYSFGLATALTFAPHSTAPRATIDDGVLVQEPLDRQITMVLLNIAFKAYDADAFSPSTRERLRGFVGAAITPTFGVTLGLSYMPVRGLGINFGAAALGISGLKDGETFGSTPVDINDPLKLEATFTLFVGASYNFK